MRGSSQLRQTAFCLQYIRKGASSNVCGMECWYIWLLDMLLYPEAGFNLEMYCLFL
jgi:hypothetical protein